MSKRCIICISKTVGVPKVEDERRILLQIIESQAAQNAKLTEQVAALTAQVEELIRKLDEKNRRKTSKNSSASPFSDGYAKPALKSQRKSSGAKIGGQDGHKGNSMKLMKEPDEVREQPAQAASIRVFVMPLGF